MNNANEIVCVGVRSGLHREHNSNYANRAGQRSLFINHQFQEYIEINFLIIAKHQSFGLRFASATGLQKRSRPSTRVGTRKPITNNVAGNTDTTCTPFFFK